MAFWGLFSDYSIPKSPFFFARAFGARDYVNIRFGRGGRIEVLKTFWRWTLAKREVRVLRAPKGRAKNNLRILVRFTS